MGVVDEKNIHNACAADFAFQLNPKQKYVLLNQLKSMGLRTL